MTKNVILLGALALSIAGTGLAQEAKKDNKGKNFKISGYVQAEYQHGQEDASLKVGGKNETKESGFDRFGIRRGRLKFSYENDKKNLLGVFQIDLTEKGLGIKDAYLQVKDPFRGVAALKAGLFDRPFGYEISYSSSKRESPERSTIFQTLFPGERDLGAMFSLQGRKESWAHDFKLDLGLFAGNGIYQETDNQKDFIGRLTYNHHFGKQVHLGLGVSHYRGGVLQGSEKRYEFKSGVGFVDMNKKANSFAQRVYYGFNGELACKYNWGSTELRGEYLFGEQPGLAGTTKSPHKGQLPSADKDTYMRSFGGGYVMLVQRLKAIPLGGVVKFDWYDPNTKISGDEIGVLAQTGKADVSVNTIGVGLLYDFTKDLRLQAYYEMNRNETSAALKGYDKDRKDNVFTLRLQYKF